MPDALQNIIAECSEAERLGQAFNDSFPLTVHCKAINEEIREEKDCLHCSQFSVYKDKVEVCDWLNPSDNITFLTANPSHS